MSVNEGLNTYINAQTMVNPLAVVIRYMISRHDDRYIWDPMKTNITLLIYGPLFEKNYTAMSLHKSKHRHLSSSGSKRIK